MTDFTEAPEPKPGPKPPAVPLRVRLKRLARRALVVLAIVAAVLAVGSRQTGRVGQKHLDAITAKLDAEEPGWRMEDIEAGRRTRMPPPDQNAATVVLAAADPLPPDWDLQWSRDAAWTYQPLQPHLPPPEHIEQLKRAAAQAVEARALALTLRDRPTGHYPVTFPDDSFTLRNPHLRKAISVSILLQFEAAFAVVVDRDPNRAVRAAHAGLNVARSLGDEPTLSAQLVRTTCRGWTARIVAQTLAWCKPTEGLAELQLALLAEAEEPVLLYLMRGHRANVHRLFSGLEAERFAYRDLFAEIGVREPTLARPAMFRAYRPLMPRDHAEALRRLTAGVAVAKLPPHEQFAAARPLLDDDTSEDVRYPITNFFVRTMESSVTSVLTSRAELVTAAVAIACERFRQKNGRWPRTLDEIPKSILPAVPVSPFDGQPLRYRVYDNRVAIFCRLAHETLRWPEPPEFDDPDAPPGIAFGVRLWNPDSRALPPKPPDPPPPEQE